MKTAGFLVQGQDGQYMTDAYNTIIFFPEQRHAQHAIDAAQWEGARIIPLIRYASRVPRRTGSS